MMQGLRFTFPKQHRLVGKKNIQTLLSKGEAFFVHPYRIVYSIENRTTALDVPIKLVIAVPKRKCKLAVQRNYIKRITREAYRLQQQILLHDSVIVNLQLNVMIQYTQSENIEQATAMQAVKRILKTLQKKIVGFESIS
jgi:ribonuclease P protein component